MKIIDISEHNGKIDFSKVKNDEIEGVIIRAGYGKGNADEYFVRNINGAIKNKLHVGIYWFSYAYTKEMATREARYCNDLIQTYKLNIDLPVFFDWEYDSMKYAKKNGAEVDKALIVAMTKAFCDEIESLGYTAGYYTNHDYFNQFYKGASSLKKYKIWFADYEDEYKNCYLQQTSDKGKIDGISGTVDTDILYGELVEIDDKKEETETNSKPKKKPVPKADKVDSEPKTGKPKEDVKPESYYKVGNTYTVDVRSALNVRSGAGKDKPLVGYNNLTSDGKQHAYLSGALMNGTKVTCLEVKEFSPKDIWIKIPSGWICAVDGNKRFVV